MTGTPTERPRRRRVRRALGNAFLVVGILTLAWTLVVWRWNDPFTALYTRWQQHELVSEHEQIIQRYKPSPSPSPSPPTPAQEAETVSRQARKMRAGADRGAPIGRINVPRLNLNMLMVNGTDHETLKRGPGRDERSFMPGQGELVYVAGHRTTYLAPFSAIDKMRAGDRITLTMPYGTFVYAVTGHEIVEANDLSVLRSHHREVLALQACHPRFFASHRYIVWAKPVEVTLPGGASYRPES